MTRPGEGSAGEEDAVAPPAWSSGTSSGRAALPSPTPRTPFLTLHSLLLPDLQEKISWLLEQRKDLTIQVQELQRQNQDLKDQVPPGTPTGTPQPSKDSLGGGSPFISLTLPLLPWLLLILVAPCQAQDRFFGRKDPPLQPITISLMSQGAGLGMEGLPV